MRTLWLLFLVGLAISEKMLVFSQSLSFIGDDIYIEDQTSGDLPIDDEDGDDYGSGSGSGDYDKEDKETINITEYFNVAETEETLPTKSAVDPANNPTTKVKDADTTSFTKDTEAKEVPDKDQVADSVTHSPSLSTTSEPDSPKEAEEDNSLDRWDSSSKTKVKDNKDNNGVLTNEIPDSHGSRVYYSPDDVTSESMWERTEVLAAVIACVVVGLLCAISLLILLAYRMKKKDEGSYDLGDNKLSTAAYQKAPSKEFYA
ncbi:syndecan-2-like [Nerophis ophidion]|uniref:syndecan-2-like n=1 Tax=Nerophis ophidion TaxID=159077 RepID=UPI002ADFAB11|nr:syndecan-2-like [Nerophis ophidion]XP_061771880.1 syndecan-2-like [Nerophis ophidion]